MSRIITPRRVLILPSKRLQRGSMVLDAFRFGASDPYFSSVVSLLHFDGADGSTTFTDEKGKVWTPAGNAQIDTSLGYNTGLFDGTGDYITSPAHADWNFGSGDWTVEAWLVQNATSGTDAVFGQWGVNDCCSLLSLGGSAVALDLTTSGSYQAGNALVSAAGVITVGTLHHVEWTRDGSTTRIYVDGVQAASKAFTGTLWNSSRVVHVAGNSQGAYDSNIHVRQFRATKGICRHPGGTSFTPPPVPFPSS